MNISDGRKVVIEFTEPLIGNVDGLHPPIGSKKSKISLSAAAVTTLNQYSTSYTGAKAVDGNTSTYWRSTTAVTWIAFELNEPKAITQIKMLLGSYYIKTFIISGSNDGIEWMQIGDVFTAASTTTLQWYTFDVANETKYLHYKIDVLTSYSSYIYLYEIQLFEDVPIGNETKFTASFDEYDMVPGGIVFRTSRKPIAIEQDIAMNSMVDLSVGSFNGLIFNDGLQLCIATNDSEDSNYDNANNESEVQSISGNI